MSYNIDPKAVTVARLFHETYEALAPQFDYKTRKSSATVWEDVPDKNRALMIATSNIVLNQIRQIVIAEIVAKNLAAGKCAVCSTEEYQAALKEIARGKAQEAKR